MTKRLIEILCANPDAECGKGADSREILLCSRKMQESGRAALPAGFREFLAAINGVYYDGAEIFGIYPQGGDFQDIVAANVSAEWEDGTHALLLGQSEGEFLLYDEDEAVYKLIDKFDECEWGCYEDWEKAAGYLLKI